MKEVDITTQIFPIAHRTKTYRSSTSTIKENVVISHKF